MPLVTEQVAALPAGYRHIVLSPHLDDAALSCGGLIARATAAGERVLVVTVCSGSPAPTTVFSPFAQSLHARWGLAPTTAVAQRRAEDAAALAALGADSLLAPELDAIYRCAEVYADETTLFATPASADPLNAAVIALTMTLAQRYPRALFYLPLAVGWHVDHQIVFAAATTALAECGGQVRYYEDFPYARQPGAVDARLQMLGRDRFAPRYVPLDETLLAAKIAALSAYTSQLAALFGEMAAMPAAVMTYAEQVAPATMRYAERLWVRV